MKDCIEGRDCYSYLEIEATGEVSCWRQRSGSRKPGLEPLVSNPGSFLLLRDHSIALSLTGQSEGNSIGTNLSICLLRAHDPLRVLVGWLGETRSREKS